MAIKSSKEHKSADHKVNPESEKQITKKTTYKSIFKNKYLKGIALGLISLVLLIGVVGSYFYVTTPANIRKPQYEHFHFRTQIIVDGKQLDFSKDDFQNSLKPTCTDKVPDSPFHFHDHLDQMTHVHWRHATGGQFLKYFGWNFIGGASGSMGRRFDLGLFNHPEVKIHGKNLPTVAEGTNYYIYAGDKDNFQEKKWNDFINQELETFFNKKSNVEYFEKSSLKDLLFPKVSAHTASEGHQAGESTSVSTKSDEELTRINNLIGNVVIFVQAQPPTNDQVKDKFDHLIPLQDSTCGG